MASFSVPCPKSASVHRPSLSTPKTPLIATSPSFQWSNPKMSSVGKLQAQVTEVALKESSNSIPLVKPATAKVEDEAVEEVSSLNSIPDAESISAFMTQVADLVKLVDSRDIVELEMKQLDCEILIRKKEAIPQTPSAAPIFMQSSYPQPMLSSPPPQAPVVASPSISAPAAPVPALPAPAKKSASSHPPFKCPMAGTFYRCSGPGEPPFVKVGDKVQKGQVLCIIEAMKLMNEIEADQSGTVAEVIAEDGKPVSVDSPLFVIVP